MSRSIQMHPLYRFGLVAGLGLLLLGLLLAWPLWRQPAAAAAVQQSVPAPAGVPAPALLPLAVPPISCKYFPQQVTTTDVGVVNSQPTINRSPNGPSDGIYIAYVSDEGGQQQIRLVNATNTFTHLTPIDAVSYHPLINNDGQAVIFLSNGDLDPDPSVSNSDGGFEIFKHAVVGTNTITTQVTVSPGDAFKTNDAPSINLSGALIAFVSDHDLDSTQDNSDGNQEIFLSVEALFISLAPQQLTVSSQMQNGEPAISGDGSVIAFISNGDAAGDGGNSGDRRNQELFLLSGYNVLSPVPPTITQLTDTGGDVTNKHPTIGNNNRRIAFVSNGNLDPSVGNDGNFEIFLYDKNVDPAGEIYQVTNGVAGKMSDQPALSADGKRLVFVSTGDLDSTDKNNGDGNQEIFVAVLNDDPGLITITQVTHTSAPVINQEPSISYDGKFKFIAFSSNEDGNFEIYRAPCEFIDLRLRKTTPDLVGRVGMTGEPFVYEFIINDDSTSPVDNVTLFDVLPAGLKIIGFENTATALCADEGEIDGQTARCVLGTIMTDTTVRLSVEAEQPGVFINSASLTGTLGEGVSDARPDNNLDIMRTVYIDPTDLEITKSEPAGKISLGDMLTYTIHVTNNGATIEAEQVVVTDTLPPGLTFVSSSLSRTKILADDFNDSTLDTDQWQVILPDPSSIATQINQRIEFTNGGYLITKNQFNPAEGRLRVTGVWTFTDGGDHLQILTRSDGVVKPDKEANQGLEFIIQARGAADHIAITDVPGNINPPPDFLAGDRELTDYVDVGDTLQFEIIDDGQSVTFTLTNITQMADPLVLTAPTAPTITTAISNHVIFHNRKPPGSGSRTSYLDDVTIELARRCLRQDGPGGSTIVSCGLDNLEPGGADSFTMIAKADNPETTPIVNTAEVGALQPDLKSKNNVATATTDVEIEGLSLEKDVSPEQLSAGEPLTYVLTVQNNEAITVNNVVVTDNLPDTVTLPSEITSTHGSCMANSNPVVCNLGNLARAEEAMITMTVLSTQRGILVNEAMVTSENELTATAVATALVDPVNLSVTKTAHIDAVELGELVTYTIQVTNDGEQPATAVVLTDTWPMGLDLVNSSGGSCSAAGPMVRCELNTLTANSTAEVTLIMMTTHPGVITNTVEIGSDDPDLDPSDNQAQAVVTVAGQAVYLPVILKN